MLQVDVCALSTLKENENIKLDDSSPCGTQEKGKVEADIQQMVPRAREDDRPCVRPSPPATCTKRLVFDY